MAGGVVIQFAVFTVLVAIVICLWTMYKVRKGAGVQAQLRPIVRAVVEKAEITQSKPLPVTVSLKSTTAQPQVPRAITPEVAAATAPPQNAVSESVISAAPIVPAVSDTHAVAILKENRNQRILASISANIRNNLIKPVPTYSPVQCQDPPRDNDYVRVKKQVITPHGQIRFSILKDSIATNMLAVMRRASLDWKTPDDLIGFLPSYLEPQAEIINDQVLLIGTPGHNEKLAIPIRIGETDSSLPDCFDFVADVRTDSNTPAVLVASDDEFEVVSRGVITVPAFMNRTEREHHEVKLLVDQPSRIEKLG